MLYTSLMKPTEPLSKSRQLSPSIHSTWWLPQELVTTLTFPSSTHGQLINPLISPRPAGHSYLSRQLFHLHYSMQLMLASLVRWPSRDHVTCKHGKCESLALPATHIMFSFWKLVQDKLSMDLEPWAFPAGMVCYGAVRLLCNDKIPWEKRALTACLLMLDGELGQNVAGLLTPYIWYIQ